jgi:phosphonate degradation associated HDIG domain protein
MNPSFDDLWTLLGARGHERYTGEPVTHLEHALQTAHLARRGGAGDALVIAALLHDVGHLIHGRAGTLSAEGIDDRHEAIAAGALERLFGPAVSGPVGLHVMAKRRLCADPRYLRALSDDSRRSLALQGGPLDAAGCEAYDALAHAQDALRLRRWDDAAKRPAREVPPLQNYRAMAEALLR